MDKWFQQKMHLLKHIDKCVWQQKCVGNFVTRENRCKKTRKKLDVKKMNIKKEQKKSGVIVKKRRCKNHENEQINNRRRHLIVTRSFTWLANGINDSFCPHALSVPMRHLTRVDFPLQSVFFSLAFKKEHEYFVFIMFRQSCAYLSVSFFFVHFSQLKNGFKILSVQILITRCTNERNHRWKKVRALTKWSSAYTRQIYEEDTCLFQHVHQSSIVICTNV